MAQEHILIIGAGGQVGSELIPLLQNMYGTEAVIASDLHKESPFGPEVRYECFNVMDTARLKELGQKYNIKQVYHLAAILSAKGEQNPAMAWDINMQSLFYILDFAKEHGSRVYWPSSIAVFGDKSPMENTPQYCVMNPSTVYGISKLAGESWCEYYHAKYGVDVRSLRYPGLISYKTLPGGGTTDYAVEIFYKALQEGQYTSFLNKGTYLPMMYMPDAIKATLDIMHAPSQQIKIRSSYNLSAISFAPEELVSSIQKVIPSFTADYAPDFRQQIADSWPGSIDDSAARADWNWQHQYDLDAMVKSMLDNLKVKLNVEV